MSEVDRAKEDWDESMSRLEALKRMRLTHLSPLEQADAFAKARADCKKYHKIYRALASPHPGEPG